MSRRRGNEIEQIHAPWWDSHEVVVVRKRLTHRDQKLIYANLASARMNDKSSKDMTMQFQIAEVQGALCKTMIKEWTFTDEQGRRIPLTPEAVDDLAQEDIEYIAEEIGNFNPVMSPNERADFLMKQEPTTPSKKESIQRAS